MLELVHLGDCQTLEGTATSLIAGVRSIVIFEILPKGLTVTEETFRVTIGCVRGSRAFYR